MFPCREFWNHSSILSVHFNLRGDYVRKHHSFADYRSARFIARRFDRKNFQGRTPAVNAETNTIGRLARRDFPCGPACDFNPFAVKVHCPQKISCPLQLNIAGSASLFPQWFVQRFEAARNPLQH